MDRIVNEIDRVNAELTPLEDRFSHTLGEAAREIQNLLDWSLALGGLILAAGGCWTCSILVQKIQQSECFSRHLRDTASDAIFVVDCASGQILESNRKAEELLGCPGYPFKGAPSSLFLPSSGSPSSGSASDGWPDYVSILTKGGLTREMGLLLPDGRTLPVEVSSNAARVGNRTVVQSIVRDVSARKQLEDSLRKAHDSALDSSRVKSEFLANMSHEIRTPMNGVLGMIGVLLDTDLTPDQRECAEVVHDSAQSLLRVINDILDFSKIEAGRLEVYPELFNWSEVIARVAEMLRPKLNEKGLELSISCDPRLPAVLNSDPARVRQVLTNLVNNAVKFTQEGSVRIVARPSGSPGLEDGIRFEVRDTGPGIPRALQSKLFQAFSQADASASRQSGGTGLGLAISKNLVELMGGTIGLVSEPGEGSMFWFELPRQPQTSSISRGLNLTSVVQTTIRA
jgi:signal transduction histidine kinase